MEENSDELIGKNKLVVAVCTEKATVNKDAGPNMTVEQYTVQNLKSS